MVAHWSSKCLGTSNWARELNGQIGLWSIGHASTLIQREHWAEGRIHKNKYSLVIFEPWSDPYFPLMRSNCLDGNYLGSKGRRKYQLAMPIAVLSILADFCNLSFGQKSTQLDNLHLYLTLTTDSNYQSGRQTVNPFIIHQERTVSPVPFKSHNRVIRVAKRTSCSAGLRMAWVDRQPVSNGLKFKRK